MCKRQSLSTGRFKNWHPCRHRQGWRADKAITSFHKNRIFVKTRKVMGNTDVAHYQGRRSICNIDSLIIGIDLAALMNRPSCSNAF